MVVGKTGWWTKTCACVGGNAPSILPSGCVHNRARGGTVCVFMSGGHTHTHTVGLAGFAVWTWQGRTNKHTHRHTHTRKERNYHVKTKGQLRRGEFTGLWCCGLSSVLFFSVELYLGPPSPSQGLHHLYTHTRTKTVLGCVSAWYNIAASGFPFSGARVREMCVCVFNLL